MTSLSDALPRTHAVLLAGINTNLHRGAQIYVAWQGREVTHWALGDARLGAPMEPDTLTLWLSAGKPISALALAQLQEQGRLQFDEPISQHLPDFAQGNKAAITFRHVLTHTGGFRDADKIPETVGWAETVRRVCQTPLEAGWIPGGQAGYHRSGSWFILGEIIQSLSGMPLGQYLRNHVFLPLGMNDSWMGMSPSQLQFYGDRFGFTFLTQHGQNKPHPHWNNETGAALCRPGSNVRGPIRDLGRFYEFLLQQRTSPSPASSVVLRPETVELMTTRQVTGLYDHTLRHPVDWGLGFFLHPQSTPAERIPYGYGPFCSADTFGHSGAQSSCAFADPQHELVVAWVCNGLPGEARHQQRAWQINRAIYRDLGLAG